MSEPLTLEKIEGLEEGTKLWVVVLLGPRKIGILGAVKLSDSTSERAGGPSIKFDTGLLEPLSMYLGNSASRKSTPIHGEEIIVLKEAPDESDDSTHVFSDPKKACLWMADNLHRLPS